MNNKSMPERPPDITKAAGMCPHGNFPDACPECKITTQAKGEAAEAPKPSPESKEREPRVEFEFVLGAHGTEADFRKFFDIISDADVLMLEGIFGSSNAEGTYNKLAKGEISIEHIEEAQKEGRLDEVNYNLFKFLHNIKKIIIPVDVPEEHPLASEIHRMMEQSAETGRRGQESFVSGRFDDFLAAVREVFEIEFQEKKKREEYIADTIQSRLGSLTEDFPQLKGKDKIKVGSIFGIAHTTLSDLLQQRGVETHTQMASTSTIKSAEDIIREKQYTGQEPEDELYARNLLEQALYQQIIGTATQDSQRAYAAAAKIASKFSIDDFRRASEFIGRDASTDMSLGQRFGLIWNALNIRLLPDSEEEIDAILEDRFRTS